MNLTARLSVLTPLALACAVATSAAQTAVNFTPSEMETFLLKAQIVKTRGAGNGVTDSRRATLSDGHVTHDAHIQAVDISKPTFSARGITELNFKDSYRFNIAGYRLARLLGLDNVPMSVERNVEGKTAAVTWWVDDVQMDEKARLAKESSGPDPERTAKQIHVMRIFDELIQNRDRNQGNILWTSDWKMWLIDHTRAFRTARELQKPDQLTRCERSLLEALRNLTVESVTAAVGKSLYKDEIAALMARRDALVNHFDTRVKERGEAVVMFALAR